MTKIAICNIEEAFYSKEISDLSKTSQRMGSTSDSAHIPHLGLARTKKKGTPRLSQLAPNQAPKNTAVNSVLDRNGSTMCPLGESSSVTTFCEDSQILGKMNLAAQQKLAKFKDYLLGKESSLSLNSEQNLDYENFQNFPKIEKNKNDVFGKKSDSGGFIEAGYAEQGFQGGHQPLFHAPNQLPNTPESRFQKLPQFSEESELSRFQGSVSSTETANHQKSSFQGPRTPQTLAPENSYFQPKSSQKQHSTAKMGSSQYQLLPPRPSEQLSSQLQESSLSSHENSVNHFSDYSRQILKIRRLLEDFGEAEMNHPARFYLSQYLKELLKMREVELQKQSLYNFCSLGRRQKGDGKQERVKTAQEGARMVQNAQKFGQIAGIENQQKQPKMINFKKQGKASHLNHPQKGIQSHQNAQELQKHQLLKNSENRDFYQKNQRISQTQGTQPSERLFDKTIRKIEALVGDREAPEFGKPFNPTSKETSIYEASSSFNVHNQLASDCPEFEYYDYYAQQSPKPACQIMGPKVSCVVDTFSGYDNSDQSQLLAASSIHEKAPGAPFPQNFEKNSKKLDFNKRVVIGDKSGYEGAGEPRGVFRVQRGQKRDVLSQNEAKLTRMQKTEFGENRPSSRSRSDQGSRSSYSGSDEGDFGGYNTEDILELKKSLITFVKQIGNLREEILESPICKPSSRSPSCLRRSQKRSQKYSQSKKSQRSHYRKSSRSRGQRRERRPKASRNNKENLQGYPNMDPNQQISTSTRPSFKSSTKSKTAVQTYLGDGVDPRMIQTSKTHPARSHEIDDFSPKSKKPQNRQKRRKSTHSVVSLQEERGIGHQMNRRPNHLLQRHPNHQECQQAYFHPEGSIGLYKGNLSDCSGSTNTVPLQNQSCNENLRKLVFDCSSHSHSHIRHPAPQNCNFGQGEGLEGSHTQRGDKGAQNRHRQRSKSRRSRRSQNNAKQKLSSRRRQIFREDLETNLGLLDLSDPAAQEELRAYLKQEFFPEEASETEFDRGRGEANKGSRSRSCKAKKPRGSFSGVDGHQGGRRNGSGQMYSEVSGSENTGYYHKQQVQRFPGSAQMPQNQQYFDYYVRIFNFLKISIFSFFDDFLGCE